MKSNYTPIDVWLQIPRVRIMRALRWFSDGISAQELGDVLDLPTTGVDGHGHTSPERSSLATTLQRLARRRTILVDRSASPQRYRLAPSVRVTSLYATDPSRVTRFQRTAR